MPGLPKRRYESSRWALRNAAPRRAYGLGGRSTLRGEVYGNVFDHHLVVYQFPEGVRVYAFCRTIDNCYDENSSLILGSKGRCDCPVRRVQPRQNDQLGLHSGLAHRHSQNCLQPFGTNTPEVRKVDFVMQPMEGKTLLLRESVQLLD